MSFARANPVRPQTSEASNQQRH